jgi:hypothetical protein
LLGFLDTAPRPRRDHMKYLTLIRSIALLHQYQRPVKSAQHGAHVMHYIEVTKEDIATANRLCHEVLGRSLDELPPQTRRLLGEIEELVRAECAKLGVDREDFRFSRREVRDATKWGQTQLRIHLGRLIEMEHVLVHRGKQGQGYVYELAYDGGGKDGSAFVPGLFDVNGAGGATTTISTSRGLAPTSRGSEGYFAGPSRVEIGGVAGPSRRARTSMNARENGSIVMPSAECDEETRHGNGAMNGASYVPVSTALSAPSLVAPGSR